MHAYEIDSGNTLKVQAKTYYFWYTAASYKDTLIELGRICACILAIYQISQGAPIGTFVMLVSYWSRFTGKSLI